MGSETDLFVPCKKVRAVVGTKEFLLLENGANIMAPSANAVDGCKGRRLLLDGPQDAQAAAAYAVLSRLTAADQRGSLVDPTAKCWHYISPAGAREGPFAARSLASWLAKGQLQRGFPVQHGPSRVWLPLWLLARHMQLATEAAAAEAGGSGSGGGGYAPMAWPLDGDVEMTDQELFEEIWQLRLAPDFIQAIADVVAMDIDTAEHLPHEHPDAAAAALLHSLEPLPHLPTPMEVEVAAGPEPPLPPAAAAQAAQAAQLLAWLQAAQAQGQVDAAAAAEIAGAAAAVAAAAAPRPRLYLVVDTNVLLRPDGLALLRCLQRRFAPRAGAGGAAAAALSCVAVVPWTVMVELDGLKGGGAKGGAAGKRHGAAPPPAGSAHDEEQEDEEEGERPVAAAARAALALLRGGLDAGDAFFAGQTLRQFREASCHPAAAIPLGAARINNDDRILQCCLHLQDELSGRFAASGRRYRVALLSNDNGLCVKAKTCGIPTASTHNFPRLPAGSKQQPTQQAQQLHAQEEEQLQQLEAALAHLLDGGSLDSHGTGAGARHANGAGSPGQQVQQSQHQQHHSPVATGRTGDGGGSSHEPSPSGAGSPGSGPGPFIVQVASNGAGAAGTGAGAAGGGAGAAAVTGLVGSFDLDEGADPLVAALHAELLRLTVGLAPVVRDVMVAEYEELWTSVLTRAPPWGGADMLELLHRHWGSTFADRLGRGAARELRSQVDQMLRDVRYFEKGRGRPRREARLLAVAEEFSRAVTDILQAFGVQPSPPPPLPAALLALRGAPAPPPPPHRASASSVPAAAGGMRGSNDGVGGIGYGAYGGGGGANQRLQHLGVGGAAAGGGEPRALHPAALRAAAVAQSIGLGVRLGALSGGEAAAGTAAASGGGGGVRTGHAAQAAAHRQAAADAASAAAAGGGGGVEPHLAQFMQQLASLQQPPAAAAAAAAAQAAAFGRVSAAQQQQQLQQHLLMRSASESGRNPAQAHPAVAAQHALLLQQQQQQRAHQSAAQQAQQQQQAQAQMQLLYRFHSEPAPTGDIGALGAAAVAAAAASLGSPTGADASDGQQPAGQADAVARQLQLLQMHMQGSAQAQQANHPQRSASDLAAQQQQQQQLAQMVLMAQQAAAVQQQQQQHHQQQQQAAVQAQAAAHAAAQAQAQLLSRAHSSSSTASGPGGGSLLSPSGSATTPGSVPTPGSAGTGPSSAGWHAMLAESHHRQQQQQEQQHQALQALLAQQQQQQLAMVGADPRVAGSAAGGGVDPEILALLQQAQLATQQQQQAQQVQLLRAMSSSGAGEELSRSGSDADTATAAAVLRAAMAAATAGGGGAGAGAGLHSGLLMVPPGALGNDELARRISEMSGSSMATD